MPAHLVLDIETIPDPELPRLDESDRVPLPPFNQIVTLGCMLLEDYLPKRLGLVGEHQAEAEMLGDFAHWLDSKKPTVVTWNGRGFRHAGHHEPSSEARVADALVVHRPEYALSVFDNGRQSGMFECFRGGFVSTLFFRSSRLS